MIQRGKDKWTIELNLAIVILRKSSAEWQTPSPASQTKKQMSQHLLTRAPALINHPAALRHPEISKTVITQCQATVPPLTTRIPISVEYAVKITGTKTALYPATRERSTNEYPRTKTSGMSIPKHIWSYSTNECPRAKPSIS